MFWASKAGRVGGLQVEVVLSACVRACVRVRVCMCVGKCESYEEQLSRSWQKKAGKRSIFIFLRKWGKGLSKVHSSLCSPRLSAGSEPPSEKGESCARSPHKHVL